jgi:hypothetical protein
MTETDFLSLLNSVDFPRRYWDLCDRFPARPTGRANLGRREDILAAFAAAGVQSRFDSRDRSFEFEGERIGEFIWSGVFAKKTCGLELMIFGESKDAVIGSNFAVLAYDAKRLADPMFERSPVKGPPPYPRPDHNGDPSALQEIVLQHVAFVRLIKEALRRRSEAG